MNHSIPITIGILTHNRATSLKKCIQSIFGQETVPECCVVIETSSDKKSQSVVLKSPNASKVVYHHRQSTNVAKSRNLLLKLCQTTYLLFLDDDCVATTNWLKDVPERLGKFDYLIGSSSLPTSQFHNPTALASYLPHQYWTTYWKRNSQPGKPHPHTIDTKKLMIHVPSLQKYRIKFDERFSDALEDTDLGYQLFNAPLKGTFLTSMKIIHQESTNLHRYLSKKNTQGKMVLRLHQKWNIVNHFLPNKISSKSLLLEYHNYTDQIKASLTVKLFSFLLIKICEYKLKAGYLGGK